MTIEEIANESLNMVNTFAAAYKNKAITELRKQYKEYLNSPEETNSLRYLRYSAKREFAINLNLVTFNEAETIETEELIIWQNTVA